MQDCKTSIDTFIIKEILQPAENKGNHMKNNVEFLITISTEGLVGSFFVFK